MNLLIITAIYLICAVCIPALIEYRYYQKDWSWVAWFVITTIYVAIGVLFRVHP